MRRSSICLLGFAVGVISVLTPTSADAFDHFGRHHRGNDAPPPVYAYVPRTVNVIRYRPVTQTRAVVTQPRAVVVQASHSRQHPRLRATKVPSTIVRRPTTQVRSVTRYRPVVQQTQAFVPIPMRPYSIPPKVRPGSGHPAFPYYGSTIRKLPNGIPVYYGF